MAMVILILFSISGVRYPSSSVQILEPSSACITYDSAENIITMTCKSARKLTEKTIGRPIDSQEILGTLHPLNYYYAYGIRNSFGIDFDPVTGDLWDTENGPAYGDEINLVRQGFNSGYTPIQGIWSHGVDPRSNISTWKISSTNPNTFVDFGGRGNYSAPEFIWADTTGVTAVKFFHSDKFGEQYKDDMFVGSIVTGDIYHFDLSEDRTQLILTGELEDKIAETSETGAKDIVFGEGFAGISDLEVGPDGYLYVVSLGQGKIFRIAPSN